MPGFSFTPLAHPELMLIVPVRHGDRRGYFTETYREEAFAEAGIGRRFVQENQSLSAQKGTIRGLHFQRPPAQQAKLMRVLQGAVFDVAVDLRAGSPHYGKWYAATLTADGGEQLFVPGHFAHGFCTIEPDTVVAYRVDGYYDPAAEGGLPWNDPAIGIPWPLNGAEPILSDRDRHWPAFSTFATPFC